MKYIAIITRTNADGTQKQTKQTINATDARTAHNVADMDNANAVSIRVYPATDTTIGIMRGAIMVGRRTAINAIMRQGTPTQHIIEREFAAINARLHDTENPARIAEVIAEYSQDTQEFYGYALQGLQEGLYDGLPIDEQYRLAYRVLNAYIHSQRAATERELSMEYIINGGGDIVSINTAIAAIIRGGEKWTAAAGGSMDKETAEKLGRVLSSALKTVNPTQKRIAELLARGNSQRQIAGITGRNERTVKSNIAIMREKIAEHIRDNSPEFSELVKAAETATAARAAADRHTNNAERMREYRKRKAAERAKAGTEE